MTSVSGSATTKVVPKGGGTCSLFQTGELRACRKANRDRQGERQSDNPTRQRANLPAANAPPRSLQRAPQAKTERGQSWQPVGPVYSKGQIVTSVIAINENPLIRNSGADALDNFCQEREAGAKNTKAAAFQAGRRTHPNPPAMGEQRVAVQDFPQERNHEKTTFAASALNDFFGEGERERGIYHSVFFPMAIRQGQFQPCGGRMIFPQQKLASDRTGSLVIAPTMIPMPNGSARQKGYTARALERADVEALAWRLIGNLCCRRKTNVSQSNIEAHLLHQHDGSTCC